MDTSTSTITVASLASVIALGILRAILKSNGFKCSINSRLVNLQARFGRSSPNSSTDSIQIPRLSERRHSRGIYPVSP